MPRKKTKWHTNAFLLTLGLLTLGFSLTAKGQGLPGRMFKVGGGSLQLKGGLLGLKDQIMLFMVVGNQTGETLWVAVEFRVPPDGKILQTVEKVKKSFMFQWPISTVSWDTEYPFSVTVYENKKSRKLLGTEKSSFFFEGNGNRKAFEETRAKLPPGQATVVNGFRELSETNLSAEVSGTLAGPELQRDITQRLFAEASMDYKDCEHRVLRAEPYEPGQPSVILADMAKESPELAKQFNADDSLVIEKWFVKSCETETAYEVLALDLMGSGTDFIVKRIETEE